MSVEFSDPYTMAQHLARRRIGANLIRQAVERRFGFAPSRYEIMRMKGEYAIRREAVKKAAADVDNRTEYLNEQEYRQNMIDGSAALLRALWMHHGAILSHLAKNGKSVVMP
jgi:hypothetical protein